MKLDLVSGKQAYTQKTILKYLRVHAEKCIHIVLEFFCCSTIYYVLTKLCFHLNTIHTDQQNLLTEYDPV